MPYSVSLQMINKKAIIFYQKNISKHPPSPISWSSFTYFHLRFPTTITNYLVVQGVLTFTERAISSLPTNISMTHSSGQWFRGMYFDFIITIFPILKFLVCCVHFGRGVNVVIYSLSHLFQDILAMFCTCFHFCR